VQVPRPDARAEAVQRVVGDLDGVGEVGEPGHRDDRAEDLLLEDPHPVLALEDSRLDVVPAGQLPAEVRLLAADQDPGAFLPADVDVGEDLLQLVVAGLRADHGGGVQRVALRHGPGALQRVGHELVVDRVLDERPGRAGAHLALVQREHREPLERLVVELVPRAGHVLEEDVRALAAKLQRHRPDVLAGVLHDQPPGGGLAGEGDLSDPGARGQRLARLHAEAVDDVDHARRDQAGDQLDDLEDRGGRLLGGLEHHGVARRQGRRQLPRGHQDREVPRDDLAHDAERLVEVVGDGLVVKLGERALLGPDGRGEVTEVINGERQVSRERLAHWLPVVPGLRHGQRLEVPLDDVGDLEQDGGPVGG
jgi:hypothetical protein